MSGGSRRGAGTPHPDLVEWVDYLREIGVRELRVPDLPAAPVQAAAPPAPTPPPAAVESKMLPMDEPVEAPDPAEAARKLEALREEIGDCTRCKLHEERTNVVFGAGDPGARLMFIGEGPGADEDAQGEPFVGRAGKKLDQMIKAIDLEREQVYIANVVKCRPPKNRAPERDEVATCSPFLFAQIEAIRPRVIVTLGAPATRTLLNTKIGITKLRGSWQSFRGIPVMPTFHPAYLLRVYTEENRRKVFDDLLAARARLDKGS